MSEKKLKRYSWSAFLEQYALLKGTHPSKWEIDWERLPKTIERDAENMPVYMKAGRTKEPECVLLHDNNRLVARRYRTGFWETFEYGLSGQLIKYENSLGARVRQAWGMAFEIHPMEIHTGNHRWILMHETGAKAIYWCALTGQFKDDSSVFSRDDMWEYFGQGLWGDSSEEGEVFQKLQALPSTSVGRLVWRLKRRNPFQEVDE